MENEKNEGIKEFGTTRLSDKKSGSGIELFTIIGEIEGGGPYCLRIRTVRRYIQSLCAHDPQNGG